MDATLYSALVHVHSVGRWVLLLLLLFAIINSLIAGKRPYIRTDNRLGLLLTIAADLMLVIGIILWFTGPWGYEQVKAAGGFGAVMKNPPVRFFVVEHMAGMLISVILIHIGKTQGRKAISDRAKHRRTLIFYFLALLIILVSIPWPFREIGATRGWY
jgi:L-asparagine transporter-like permease